MGQGHSLLGGVLVTLKINLKERKKNAKSKK
jgi:hypothetical protein